jgi:hypothetical protein
LGVPTVADRVAQMVVKQLIEPDLDPIFQADSFGYRPGKARSRDGVLFCGFNPQCSSHPFAALQWAKTGDGS